MKHRKIARQRDKKIGRVRDIFILLPYTIIQSEALSLLYPKAHGSGLKLS